MFLLCELARGSMGEYRAIRERMLGGSVSEPAVQLTVICHLRQMLSICAIFVQKNLNTFILSLLNITSANLTLP